MVEAMKQVLYLTCLIYAVVIGENSKRLLLNDPDVATRFAQMEITIQKLTEQLSQLENNASAGSTYVRWGRSVCSGDNTELVYSGYAAGQLYLHASYTSRHGGPSNLLCMPGDPELTNISGNGTSLLYGAEYQENILKPDAHDEDVPCAVCRNKKTQNTLMIPGRKSCYSGWQKEYQGLVVSGHRAYSASSYLCMDRDPEYIPGGHVNNDGSLLFVTTTKCGSLPCPPYTDDKAINCVVCSK
ncbi:short-chain collagen C4-like [Mytilus californianus]|uniref:short-chain collagen C4-like n=1 Tax=Mytilus californianus TaxID=6549 RepID=UPI002246CC22|nr:short-chain collagen C4-like [Mytilus californianus]XP_052071652.1 short-chain collagen C4-like [Mytilus californianus]